jgi:hypothetical protein
VSDVYGSHSQGHTQTAQHVSVGGGFCWKQPFLPLPRYGDSAVAWSSVATGNSGTIDRSQTNSSIVPALGAPLETNGCSAARNLSSKPK